MFPSVGTLWPRGMNLIGASLLTDYSGRHPEAAAALAGLHALIREAHWTCQADVESQFHAIARFEAPGTVTLTVTEARLRAVLEVNYALGLVRVAYVQQLTTLEGRHVRR